MVERSVAIATIASRELVLKDFALEGNDEKMRKAAHLMVQSLSGIFILFYVQEVLQQFQLESRSESVLLLISKIFCFKTDSLRLVLFFITEISSLSLSR